MEINSTLIGQLITFALLVWFTMKFVWPPISKAMLEREMKIAAGLEASELSKRELEQAELAALSIINDAKLDASKITEQAHKRSLQMIDEAKESAKVEATRIVDRAQDDIALELSKTKEALRKQLAGLAIAAAEKIIKHNLDVSTNTVLLDEFAAQI